MLRRLTPAAWPAALALLASLLPGVLMERSTAVADTGAQVVAESRIAPRTVDLTIDSPAMNRRENVRLLLPPGWSKDADRSWPTLWLLHGGMDGYEAWTRDTDVAELTARTGVIVVMPNGGRCGNYSDWWNYGDGGSPQWETFHLTELRQILERDYNAGEKRVIAGNSMGGLGAMLYAARFPGMFEAAAAFSGYLHTLHGHEPGDASTGWGPALSCPGTDWRRVWGHPDDQATVWHAHNPADVAGELRGVELWVASGNGEPGPLGWLPFTDPVEAAAHEHARAFTDRLDDLDIPVTTRFYDGQHTWPYWERELHRAYPMLTNALDLG